MGCYLDANRFMKTHILTTLIMLQDAGAFLLWHCQVIPSSPPDLAIWYCARLSPFCAAWLSQ